MRYLLLFLAAYPDLAQAKNFALVLGGAGRQADLGVHDFIMPSAAASLCLKSSGYDVRTLIGAQDPTSAPYDNEKIFPEDYQFLKDQKIATTPATETNIKDQLSQLVSDVKSERAKGGPVKVELVINTHGTSLCLAKPGESGYKPGNISGVKKECNHYIDVFDGQKVVQVNSSVFRSYVEEMQKSGATVNLNLNSCNAGAARKHFDDLPGTCTFYGSVDQTLATGCSKGIPGDVEGAWWNSNTFVNMFRSCGGKFDELLAPKFKGYFSENGCFTGLKKHIEEKKIDLSSVSSAYFSERKESTSFEASFLSCFEMELISGTSLAKSVQTKTEICGEAVDLTIGKLMGHLSDALLTEAWGNFSRSMEKYDQNLNEQYAILPQDSEFFVRDGLSQAEATRLAALEKQAETLAAKMIADERALFDRYTQLEPGKFAKCKQGACGTATIGGR